MSMPVSRDTQQLEKHAAPGRVTAQSAGPGRETVAVVIPTYNVGDIIGECLDRVRWADEVIVVDMFSTDQTAEVCRRYPNVRFFQRRDYIFGNVNFGMEQATADWVIRLDSDELLSSELQESIQAVLAHPESRVSGYRFPSVQFMFGEPLRHGVGLPERNLRKCMFRRGAGHYLCRSEHEDILTDGPIGVLRGHFEHRTNHTVDEVLRKTSYYTSKDLERVSPLELGPPRPWRALYRSVRMFVLYYFQWRGYKDGYLGFFSSLFRGPMYILIEEAKRWERWRGDRPGRPGDGPEAT